MWLQEMSLFLYPLDKWRLKRLVSEPSGSYRLTLFYFYAILRGQQGYGKLLVEDGANIEAKDPSDETTPLMARGRAWPPGDG